MASEIGGWFASAAVSNLVDSICSFISGRYEIATGVNNKLQSLESSLVKIKMVIGAVERKWPSEDPIVVSWLKHLKDAVFDAEDILDFFNYQTLCRSDDGSGNEGSSGFLVNALRKGAKKARTCSSAIFPDDSLYDLSDIVERLDRLSDDGLIGTFLKVTEMNTDSKKEDESFDRRQTSPVLAEANVLGRSKEKDKLRDKILVSSDKNGSNGEKFSMVSIVGIGGMGKTTLAQWLYNCEDVKNHFDLQAWVCTSGKSDMATVMTSIIEYATKSPCKLKTFAPIHEDLLRLLSEKRFLIVLDDVCDEIINQWDKLISVFRHGKEGSKIIITTRKRIVAGKVNSMDDEIYLEGLRKEEYWELFRCCAFGKVNPKDHLKLEYIGQQIASKLGGLPLAAKTVGGVLKERLEERHWRDVLENKEWQKEGDILPSLRLSYNLLPPELRQCFVYCALFPKDYYFNKDTLVHIWVAQGFVKSSQGTRTPEDIGRKYFDQLYSRSFFQDAQPNHYVIHNLLHDLAELICADEIYREENISLVQLNISKRVRHLFISSNDLDRVLAQIEEPKKLRSLVCYPPYTSNISQTSCLDFKKLRGLRVLMLREPYSSSHLLETIDNMIHLRYLKCPFGNELPISLGRLYNLQVLELFGISDRPNNWSFLHPEEEIDEHKLIDDSQCLFFIHQTTMSKIFGKLTNLRYINARRRLIYAIPSIGKLTSLQELTHYSVREQEGNKICELRNLNKIRGFLRIVNLENVADKEEAKEAELHNKVHLEALSLWWNKSENCSNDEVREHEEVLEGLQPHSNIKVIYISRYMGLKHPSWLNKSYLSNIEGISLFACGCLKALPPVEEFPFLKYLYLDSLTSIEKIGGGEVFQSLQHLQLKDLKELKEWLSIKEDVCDMMPHLSSLKIIGCNKLEALPLGGLQYLEVLVLNQLDSLTKIETKTNGGESTVLPELGYLKLSSMKELKEWLAPDDGQSLMLHLTTLEIVNCPNLKVIPPLGELRSLEGLKLEGLDLLEEIGIDIYGRESIAFPSLRRLNLNDLKELKKWSSFKEDVGGMMPRLSRLEISRCNKLEALPPLGGLQYLEHLVFNQLDSLTKIETKTNGGESTVLPKLGYLKLSSMKELKEWLAPDDCQSLMLHLTTLDIINCPNLRVIPPLRELRSLEGLKLEGLDLLVEISLEPDDCQSLMLHLTTLEIINCPNFKVIPPLRERNHQSLMLHLTTLKIINCPNLKVIPPLRALRSLEGLKLKGLDLLEEISLEPDDCQSLMLHLTSLEIINCPNLKIIPPLGELRSLEDVKLKGLDLLEEISIEIYGRERIAFPSLRHLHLSDLKELKKWSSFKKDVCDMMPHLSELKIVRCNKLEAIPSLGGFHAQLTLTIKDCSNLKLIALKELPSFQCLELERLDSLEEIDIPEEEQGRDLMPHLQSLTIIDCHKLRRPTHFTSSLEDLTFGISKTVDGMQMFHELFPVGTLTRLKILSLGPLTGLDFFTGAQQEWLQSLTSLTMLIFKYCSDLRSLPDVLESLCQLEQLTLIDCPKIVSLGQNNLPKNLKEMYILECRELGKLCDWRQDGREWSKIFHIPYIKIGYEVIPHPTPAQCSRGK